MTKECKHEWNKDHPIYVQCMKCEKSVPIVYMKNMSEEEFKKLYSQNPECGPVIFDDAPDFKR